MDPILEFKQEVEENITVLCEDKNLHNLGIDFIRETGFKNYSYNFTALGRPIIQYPQDMIAMQEIIWNIRPDLIIEMGIAHGGSLIANAAALAQLDYCDAVEAGKTLDPKATKRKVLGVDIDIRAHNKAEIEKHPMAHHIDMIEGSSIDSDIISQVHDYAKDFSTILVSLDSNHTHDHVLAELKAYAPLTSVGSYCIVYDSSIEHMPDDMFNDRPWGKGNNPKTALHEYLRILEAENVKAVDGQRLKLKIDERIESKILVTVASDGYLKRVA
jgi:cephalosporin hydroxylase